MAASKSHPPQPPRDKASPAAAVKKIRAGMGDVDAEMVEVWTDEDYQRATGLRSILREDGRTIVFQVASAANKLQIKRAVEQLLGSKVASIRTSIAHGKVKRQGRFAGRRSDWKKAFVKLREGEKMPEFLEGA